MPIIADSICTYVTFVKLASVCFLIVNKKRLIGVSLSSFCLYAIVCLVDLYHIVYTAAINVGAIVIFCLCVKKFSLNPSIVNPTISLVLVFTRTNTSGSCSIETAFCALLPKAICKISLCGSYCKFNLLFPIVTFPQLVIFS